MSDEKKNLPTNEPAQDTEDEQQIEDEEQIDSSAVGISAETDAEGSSQTPEERLRRIAEEHDVPVERDPEDAQAKAEGSSPDKDRDIGGGDTNEEEDDSVEPPD
ncbi:hypothetical protein [Brevibacterium oceani]|uniref:hypothetical protein n=1 Tax=Brevibacterium oceani TaxID=358099 RepID=UPI001B338CB8|nr:hypothetical protein [Brevibacterium oceani]